jgi:hypothetical protein
MAGNVDFLFHFVSFSRIRAEGSQSIPVIKFKFESFQSRRRIGIFSHAMSEWVAEGIKEET